MQKLVRNCSLRNMGFKGTFERTPEIEHLYDKAPKEDIVHKFFSQGAHNVVWSLNKYPYDVPNNIMHTILWFSPTEFDKPPSRKEVDQFCKSNGIDTKLWMVNPPHLRTKPGIVHIHVFVPRETYHKETWPKYLFWKEPKNSFSNKHECSIL